ncbi:TRAP transporter large permease [Microbacterium pseudoresistens]|uniref:Tripartite ATP-independent transporter DctM subunit n=1 Tax=Microbacterium pseudoresistens TaxID=640634 RepID=A0A7Y9EVB7_9MICO|nr:TRAP transporter large permease [Microbacterium pseudoresistens]NYD54612.1 tripartite ATP-independent transporter DctM subunit [Microbacterium pseudoresistens]
MTILIPVILLLLLFLLGMPIALALTAAGLVGIVMVTGNLQIVLQALGSEPYSTAADYALTTIPAFVFMAYLADRAGLAEDLYRAAEKWLAPMRGGLAVATTFASATFGAMSGASTASAAVMSRVAYPNMQRAGYDRRLSTGTIAIGSTLSSIVPPSVAMVVFSIATETSLRSLLLAGVLPGIILAVLVVFAVTIWVRVRPALAPQVERHPLKVLLASLKPIWLGALVIVILMLLLYGGFATPTEIGAVGAVVIGLVGVLRGKIRWAEFVQAVENTLRTTALIFLIIIGAGVFGLYLTLSRLPQNLVAFITDAGVAPWLVILLICVGYLVLSMFMDENPLLLITLPLTFPLVLALGFDPIWFGVVTLLLAAIGLVCPPVGMSAFVVASASRVPVDVVYRGTLVLMIPMLVCLGLVLLVPDLSLWLPTLLNP